MVQLLFSDEMISKEIRENIKWVYNNLSWFQNRNDSECYQGRKRGLEGQKIKGEKERRDDYIWDFFFLQVLKG